MKYLWLGLLVFVFTMPGCGGRPFTADVPSDWRASDKTRYGIVYSRQGKPLQMVVLQAQPFGNELDFTKKKFVKGMLPHEAAEVVADAVRLNPHTARPEIMENVPARLVVRFRNTNGSPINDLTDWLGMPAHGIIVSRT